MKTLLPVLVTILIVAVCFTQSILISGSEGDPDQFGEAVVCSKELQDVDASDLRGLQRMEKHGGCGSRL